MDLEKALIRQSRECIKAHSLDDLKSLCKRADVLSREGACSVLTLYKLLMNNTCIYGTQEMVVWLMEVFSNTLPLLIVWRCVSYFFIQNN